MARKSSAGVARRGKAIKKRAEARMGSRYQLSAISDQRSALSYQLRLAHRVCPTEMAKYTRRVSVYTSPAAVPVRNAANFVHSAGGPWFAQRRPGKEVTDVVAQVFVSGLWNRLAGRRHRACVVGCISGQRAPHCGGRVRATDFGCRALAHGLAMRAGCVLAAA